MSKKMRRKSSNGLVVLLMVMVITAVTTTTTFAAPLAMEEVEWLSVAGEIITRILVIAGAMLLLSVWQKWRERRNGKDQKEE